MPRKTPNVWLGVSAENASMRPRPDAAENTSLRYEWRYAPICFNEAAARCRGKLGLGDAGSRANILVLGYRVG